MLSFGSVQPVTAALGAAALAFMLTTGAAFAADHFVGKYKTVDTKGNPMSITLTEDGKASGDRDGEALSGTWKEKKETVAVIKWDDGWTTRIRMKGDEFAKVAWEGKRPEEKLKSEKAEKVE